MNISQKVAFFLCAWFLCAIFSNAHAMDEYNVGTQKLADAEELKLTAGKSFVLECHEKVDRVAVGKSEIADVRALSEKKILINAIRAGTTNLIVWYADDTSEAYNLTVMYDIAEIQKKLKQMIPDAALSLSSSFGMLMVDGYVEDQKTMDRIMRVLQAFVRREYIKNLLTLKGAQQVQLEAKIVEISRSDIKRYGLNFLLNGSINGGRIGGGLLAPGSTTENTSIGLSGVPATPARRVTSPDGTTTYTEAVPEHFEMESEFSLSSAFENAFQVAFHLLDDDISGILSFLKSQGLATVMARPTLVAMSGQEASFHVGGSFPVPVTASYGSTGFDEQEYGVELEFVPTVTGKETIHLVVKTSVSDIDYSTSVTSGGATVPGIVTREASSTLQLKDGQTFAIAGLLKETIDSVVNKVPFLGDIPVLGVIFRSKDYVKYETELIIMVTPRLVKPMNKEEVPVLPGEMEDFNQDDWEFFFLDRIWKQKDANKGKMPRFSGEMDFENWAGRSENGGKSEGTSVKQ